MRVVQDSANRGRRRTDPKPVDVAPQPVAVAAPVPAARRLSLLTPGLFLLACAAGGVLVAVVRPLGLG
jgi:hypothetical protein